MRSFVIATALALLAGCASSPAQLQEGGQKTETTSAKAPLDAAACIVRRAEEMNFGIGMKATVTMRPAATTGGQEVVIYGTDLHGAMGYVRVLPTATGSTITVWRANVGLLGLSEIDHVADGC